MATMMGNQGTANNGLRKAAALVKAGALGDVKEAHIWTNRPIWPQGENRPQSIAPPKELHWDLWLAGAANRPYGANAYHTFKWRGWWDFGSGAWATWPVTPSTCLSRPSTFAIPAPCSAVVGAQRRLLSEMVGHFLRLSGQRKTRPGQGLLVRRRQAPAGELFDGRSLDDIDRSGALLVGSKGKLYSPGDYCDHFEIFGNKSLPEVNWVHSPGHFAEWVRAIKGGDRRCPISPITPARSPRRSCWAI